MGSGESGPGARLTAPLPRACDFVRIETTNSKIANVTYAAEYFRVPRSKLYRLISEGKLSQAFIMTGGVWCVVLEELERFFDTHPLERK